jgi:hypothetical protein
MWIKHPRTKEPDTMLTLAVAGFIFSGVIVAAMMTYSFVKGLPLSDFSSVATLVASVLTPTVAAYTVRKYTDFRSGKSIKQKEDK